MDLHYTDTGRGFPVVFVHAFPLDGRMWEHNSPAVVEAGFRVIIPDLPGFGKSPSHPQTASMEFYASSINEILVEEGIGNAVFCGLSMGGYALLALYRARPELFAGLVLCDTTADADTDEKRKGRGAMIDSLESKGAEILVRDLLPNLISASTLENDATLVGFLSGLIREQPVSAVCAALRGMAERHDSKDVLEGMDFPVKLIFGEDDAVTGEPAAISLQSRISDPDLVFIKDAGHFSNLENPTAFNHELMSYLKTLELTY